VRTVARAYRARGVKVVLGYHVTLIPDEAAREADAIVIGSAETVWKRVLDDARSGKLAAVYRGDPTPDLAHLRPRREIYRGKDYQDIALVEYARGCNFRCDFCAVTAFHGARQHHRPARDVAAEIEASGKKRFFVVDDNVVSQPKARVVARARALGISGSVRRASPSRTTRTARALARSGLSGTFDRHESADPANLHTTWQGLEPRSGSYANSLQRFSACRAGVYGTFVFGYDNDDRASVQAQRQFAREQALPRGVQPSRAVSGTPLSRLASEGRLGDRDGTRAQTRVSESRFPPDAPRRASRGAPRGVSF
jgi:hypothetical protein